MIQKVLSVLLCFALILVLVGCGKDQVAETEQETTIPVTEAPTEPPFDSDKYKRKIENCASEMNTSAVFLTNLATFENNKWQALDKLGGTVTAEDLASAAWEWLEKEGWSKSTVESQFSKVSKSYKEIISIEIDGTETEEIKSIFDEYFDAYIALYNLVSSPSGTNTEFVDACNDYISTIETCQSKLDILLS